MDTGAAGADAGDAEDPGTHDGRASAITPKKLTVLQIRDFVSAEFEPVPLADVLSYFQAQEKAGIVKLVEKAPEPVKGKKK